MSFSFQLVDTSGNDEPAALANNKNAENAGILVFVVSATDMESVNALKKYHSALAKKAPGAFYALVVTKMDLAHENENDPVVVKADEWGKAKECNIYHVSSKDGTGFEGFRDLCKNLESVVDHQNHPPPK